MNVGELSPAYWRRIEDKGRAVVNDVSGLRASIEERERVVVWWSGEELVGLVTQDLRRETFRGREVVCIYAGNAWMQRRFRGSNRIQRLAFRTIAETVVRWPRADKYWFFGSNNYKSYLLMSRNLRDFWPSHREPTPSWETDYICHLARAIYRTDVDPARPVYDPNSARSFSKDETRVPNALADDPDVRFFAAQNPNYPRGAKLMCLASLSVANVASIGRKALARAVRSKRRY